MKSFWRGHTCGYRLGIIVGLGERGVTERAFFDVLEQKGAAMRAYLYHWSVLRCGIPVKEHRYDSTRPEHHTRDGVP
jgi:predicted Zn-dependent peptidase